METRLQTHTGRAVVFKDYNDMAARIDDPDLDVDADSVIVLQNAGPQGAPGMPERSEEHTSELQSLMRISYAVFCLKKKKQRRSTYKLTSTIFKYLINTN